MTGIWKAVAVVDVRCPAVQVAVAMMKAAVTSKTFFAESECRHCPSLIIIILIGDCWCVGRRRQMEPSGGHDKGGSDGAGPSKMMVGAVGSTPLCGSK